MTLPELLIIRHGETVWNAQGRIQGRKDSPLTAKGREQARHIGEILARPGILTPKYRAATSPLGRAQETARIALDGKLRWVNDDRLAELDVGTVTGMTKEEAFARHPFLDQHSGKIGWQFHCPDGESFSDISGRIESWLGEVTHPTVVVAHGVVSRVMRTLILGLGVDGASSLTGGQGVIHRIRNGHSEILE